MTDVEPGNEDYEEHEDEFPNDDNPEHGANTEDEKVEESDGPDDDPTEGSVGSSV